MFNKEELKDIVVALINNGYFPKYSDVSKLGVDVAKVVNSYLDEAKSNQNS